MPNHEKILESVPTALLEHESWKAPYKVRVRPSAMPFCQVEYLFAKLDPLDSSVGDSFMEKIFVNIGTATHEVLQTYLGRAGLLYGKWKCKKCYYISSPTLGTPYCGDKKLTWERGTDLQGEPIGPEEGPCNKGFATRYEEFTLVDPVSGLKGSCDGLILVAGRLYLLEAKTKASSAIVKKLTAPDPPHVHQASTYAAMATPREWGLNQDIEGIAFVYIPRDYPNKMRVLFHDLDPSTLENFRQDFPGVKVLLKKGNLEDAKGICPNQKYAEKMRYCVFAAQCFRPDRAEFLKKKRKEYMKAKRAEKATREAAEKREDIEANAST
jgi:hypothetical protein